MGEGHDFNFDNRGVYVTAHADVQDDSPAYETGFVGMTVKQQQPKIDAAVSDRHLIKAGEKYYLVKRGEVTMAVPAAVAAPAVGTPLYIDKTTNAVDDVPSANAVPFGRISEVYPGRGLPVGTMRVDLDTKPYSFATA